MTVVVSSLKMSEASAALTECQQASHQWIADNVPACLRKSLELQCELSTNVWEESLSQKNMFMPSPHLRQNHLTPSVASSFKSALAEWAFLNWWQKFVPLKWDEVCVSTFMYFSRFNLFLMNFHPWEGHSMNVVLFQSSFFCPGGCWKLNGWGASNQQALRCFFVASTSEESNSRLTSQSSCSLFKMIRANRRFCVNNKPPFKRKMGGLWRNRV